MKRYTWLAIVLWIVTHDTDTREYECSQIQIHQEVHGYVQEAFEEKWVCDDHATALNESHRRRTDLCEKLSATCGMTVCDGGNCYGCCEDYP